MLTITSLARTQAIQRYDFHLADGDQFARVVAIGPSVWIAYPPENEPTEHPPIPQPDQAFRVACYTFCADLAVILRDYANMPQRVTQALTRAFHTGCDAEAFIERVTAALAQ